MSSEKVKKNFSKYNSRYVLTGILLVIFLVAGVLFLKQWRADQRAKRPTPLPEVAYYPVPKTRGPDDAPIKLVEYSDFECPACRAAEGALSELFLMYPGKIQLTYHHFPLSSHKWSPYAHQAAECMHIQGKFWPYHDLLYRKQPEWVTGVPTPVETLVRYASDCGADMDIFESCMKDEAVTRGIDAEKEEGTRRQVNATPTVFFGDQRFIGPVAIRNECQNAIRKTLGLPPLSSIAAEVKAEPLAPEAAGNGK